MSIKEMLSVHHIGQKIHAAFTQVTLRQIMMFCVFLMFLIQQYQISKIPKANSEIVSVDVGKLSAYIAKDIGASDLDNLSQIEQKKKLLLDFTNQTLQDTAKFNNLLIIPSDVMIAGEIRDITDIVLHAFEKGK
jgi:hypothetical protein